MTIDVREGRIFQASKIIILGKGPMQPFTITVALAQNGIAILRLSPMGGLRRGPPLFVRQHKT